MVAVKGLGNGVNRLFADMKPDISESEAPTMKEDVQPTMKDIKPLNSEVLDLALSESKAYPKITVYAPHLVAVFRYLQLTIPRYSMSGDAARLLEDAVAHKYPVIYDEVMRRAKK